MKNLFWGLSVAILISVSPINASALPYTDADITINGALRSGDGTYDESLNWEEEGTSIFSYVSGWLEYTVVLQSGNWNIGLNAINTNGQLPYLYNNFNITFTGTDVAQHIDFYIPASDSEINNGFINLDITTAGTYTYKFEWTNDEFIENGADANIKVLSAFFDNTAGTPGPSPIPEPATMLLFGSGLAGLAAVGRRRKTQ